MVRVSVTVSDSGLAATVRATVQNRAALNRVLADRLVDELRAHFAAKNKVPNKMGAPKTGFWNQVSAATGVAEVSESGAVVAVAEQRFRIHLFGGVITPKRAKYLTIPLVREARGLFARSYSAKFGRRLFTVSGRNALFEKVDTGGSESTVAPRRAGERLRQADGATVRRTFTLAARSQLRAVYALAKSARIPRDPQALPPPDRISAALTEEAAAFVEREARRKKGATA